MNRVVLAFSLAAAVFVGVIVGGAGGAAASCFGPEITLSPTQGAPGAAVVVTGRYFISTCNDTVVNGVPPVPNAPQKGVAITFDQGGRRTLLTTVDASGPTGTFTVSIVVPATARAGSAQFEASRPEGPAVQAFTVVVGRDASLPRTGSRTVQLLLDGLAALALGGVLFVFGLRTRR